MPPRMAQLASLGRDLDNPEFAMNVRLWRGASTGSARSRGRGTVRQDGPWPRGLQRMRRGPNASSPQLAGCLHGCLSADRRRSSVIGRRGSRFRGLALGERFLNIGKDTSSLNTIYLNGGVPGVVVPSCWAQ